MSFEPVEEPEILKYRFSLKYIEIKLTLNKRPGYNKLRISKVLKGWVNMGYLYDFYELANLPSGYIKFLKINCVKLDLLLSQYYDYKPVELGELFSLEMIKHKQLKREHDVESILENIIFKLELDKIIITNIDVLFNPSYRLNVIKFFISISRNRNIILNWPGQYDSENLIYSEPEYDDYKKYPIKDYDVICLK